MTATRAGRTPPAPAPAPAPAPDGRRPAARQAAGRPTPHSHAPQAAPTRARATASAAGRMTGAAAAARPQTQPRPVPQPATRPPLRIVAPPDPEVRGRRRRRLVVGALVGLAGAGLFAIVGVRVLLAQGQAPIDTLESQVTAAQAENQRLRLDVARLESPARIVAEAQARLGMVPPAVVVYLPPLSQSPPAQSPPAQSPVQPAG